MRTLKLMTGILLCLAATRPVDIGAQEPAWNPTAIKECDRACLVGIMDGYMNALFAHNPKGLMPTSFKIYIADPVSGQVALQGRCRTW